MFRLNHFSQITSSNSNCLPFFWLQEIADDPFGDKENKFNNGNTYNDGFGQTEFATAFDDNVPNVAGFAGFDDSFGGRNFAATKNDPFAANLTSDPFGDKKSSTAVTPDVRRYFYHTYARSI